MTISAASLSDDAPRSSPGAAVDGYREVEPRGFEDNLPRWWSPELAVDGYRCAPAGVGRTGAYRPPALKVCLPSAGVCTVDAGARTLLSDATRVLVLDPTRLYEISHLACGCRAARAAPAAPPVSGTVITVDPTALARLAGEALLARLGAAVQVPMTPEIGLLHGELLALAPDDGGIEELALALLTAVASSAAGDAATARTDAACPRAAERTVTAVKSLVASAGAAAWPLAALAEELGCSRFYLCRTFRRVTGLTIHRYQNLLRLQAAIRRLAAGERDLTGLALDLGFSSHSHFTASFRRELGTTPSAARARYRRSAERR